MKSISLDLKDKIKEAELLTLQVSEKDEQIATLKSDLEKIEKEMTAVRNKLSVKE
jgi:uncharacterized small protein (DUF1192 family)